MRLSTTKQGFKKRGFRLDPKAFDLDNLQWEAVGRGRVRPGLERATYCCPAGLVRSR